MAQLQLQQGKVTEALKQFERAAELARTEGELVNALSYAEATRTQITVQEKYPKLAARLQGMGPAGAMGRWTDDGKESRNKKEQKEDTS